jgi:hypothetical protein
MQNYNLLLDYDLNNFHYSYGNIIVDNCKSWKIIVFKFLNELFFEKAFLIP